MFGNLTYRTKNKLLFVVAVIIAFLSYKFAIKNTITQFSEYTSAKKEIDFAKDIPTRTLQIKMKIQAIDKALNKGQENGMNVQENLLGVITSFCRDNNIVLREFPITKQNASNEFLIETNIFKIEGPFVKLLRLLYILEQKRRFGKISSVLFKSKIDFKTKSTELTATVYLQHISKLSDKKVE